MAKNEQLTDKLALDLGVKFINRRPYAREIFKKFSIDLLPHSSTDTLAGELYERKNRNWSTTNDNIVGVIAEGQIETIDLLIKQLKKLTRHEAQIPDFEFSKEEIIGMGLKLPSLFNIGFTGQVENAKNLSVKVNGVTKSRITNYEEPGIKIIELLSALASHKPKTYKQKVPSKYIAEALFYAESVEILLEKESGSDIGIDFDLKGVTVTAETDTDVKKVFKLAYKGKMAPFAATFVKGKDFF